MVRAMEAQASAERERKAMVTKAEGSKQSAILQAEARLEAAKRDAEAQVTLAEASAESIRRIASAIGNQDAPMRYLLGERYLHAMGKLAESSNAKTIVLPADIQESLRGLLGRSKD
jgi:regulator of protease activity HflC (stomatin/prohibitin superfamily)